jgi:uncharacterized membrane protein YozB (DUF420 family)
MKFAKAVKAIKNNKGQAAVEYILTTAFLFAVFVIMYAYYSRIVPKQFEQGAKIILAVYEYN